MLVARNTYKVKPGCVKELIELHKSLPELFPDGFPHGGRIYSPGAFSTWDVVIWEADYENLAEYEAAAKAIHAYPGFPEWRDKWRDLTERGTRAETWTVEYVK